MKSLLDLACCKCRREIAIAAWRHIWILVSVPKLSLKVRLSVTLSRVADHGLSKVPAAIKSVSAFSVTNFRDMRETLFLSL
jgi:hypothetical protein